MPNPLAGQCYVVSEALYHMLGGKAAGWTPIRMKHEGTTHWALYHRESGVVLDATTSQFKVPPDQHDYEKAIGCGFLTKKPSKRARALLRKGLRGPIHHG